MGYLEKNRQFPKKETFSSKFVLQYGIHLGGHLQLLCVETSSIVFGVRTKNMVLNLNLTIVELIKVLNTIKGLVDTLKEFAITNKKPLLGICVGLQMFADVGYEETETKGLGWISGKVSKIDNQNGKFKLPHIGWNEIEIVKESNLFKSIKNKSHMYFVHSYEFIPEDKFVISATTDYSSKIVCSVERNNLFGTQFHPEKSDKEGLKIIDNFLSL